MKKSMFPHPTHYPTELARIALDAAIEVDNILIKESTNRTYLKKFTEGIKKYELKGDETLDRIYFSGPYRAIMRSSKKDIKQVDELALEMNLLNTELANIDNLSKQKLENLKKFLIEFYDNDQEEIRGGPPRNPMIKY